jgi:hypothetical protein
MSLHHATDPKPQKATVIYVLVAVLSAQNDSHQFPHGDHLPEKNLITVMPLKINEQGQVFGRTCLHI